MAGVLIRKERFEDTEEILKRKPYEDGSRDWGYAITNQGTLRIANNHQKLREAGKILPQNYQREHVLA